MVKFNAFNLWCSFRSSGSLRLGASLGILLLLTACSSQTVKTTTFTPIEMDPGTPEEELLDVGVAVFDPGLEDLDEDEAELTFADVRRAETFYSSDLMASTLQGSGNWGIVRVMPGQPSNTDVAVYGTLLQSDGETMRVQVKVEDVSGRIWFDREYEEIVSKFSYDPRLRRNEDAFQGLYNRIANDMLAWRKKNLSRQDLLDLRTISRIRFAQRFAPDVYNDYLEEGRRGRLEIQRLPAANDPIMQRIDSIRERDYAFVDTLQEYYTNFSRQMETPYTEFRRLSYDEVMEYNKLRRESTRNMVLGIAAIVAGLAATQSDVNMAPYLTYGGIAAGAFLIKDAIYTNDEAKLHIETIAELGDSLETDVTPKTIELEERTVTLSGNVESQYEQWRDILADIYAAEIGEIQRPPDSASASQSL